MKMIDISSLLFLLLPAAAASGWWAARRHYQGEESHNRLPNSDYLKGMNYLLNEEPDKAVEVFVRLMEVDNETVDTHLALGTLFRRRGEVERAIRIHQNLIARPNLNRSYKEHAVFELAQDYLKAGVLDRAETLLQDLRGAARFRSQALRLLMQIYEQEKDWEGAARIAQELQPAEDAGIRVALAHYYCELAESAYASNDKRLAKDYLQSARIVDWTCVRSSILEGRYAFMQADYRNAIRAYRRVLEQDPRFVVEIIEPIHQCYNRLGDFKGETTFLKEAGIRLRHQNGVTLPSINQNSDLLTEFTQYVSVKPELLGIYQFITLWVQRGDQPNLRMIELLHLGLSKVLDREDRYRCQRCGFSGKLLYWQCPSCKQWSGMLPTAARLAALPTHDILSLSGSSEMANQNQT